MLKLPLSSFLIILLVLLAPIKGWSKTITLTSQDVDLAANIGEESLRQGWLGWTSSNYVIFASGGHGFLIRYSLDKIPKGQRITYVELKLQVSTHSPQSRLHIWRLIAEWGAGVSHQFRMLRPKKLEWTVLGARGNSTDRATKPTSIMKVNEDTFQTVNVTEDVELWYTGATSNCGWLITGEDAGTLILLGSPIMGIPWELQVTYEPQ